MGKDEKKAKSAGFRPGKFNLVHAIITVILVLLILWILAGGINQVATGEKIIDWTVRMANEIGQVWIDLFNNEGPVQVTDQGVYFDGAEPPAN